MTRHSTLARLCFAATALAAAAVVPLDAAAAVEFETSGFASLVAGRSYGQCQSNVGIAEPFARECTRFITDWSHAGVYVPHWSVAPETRLGLQGTATLDARWSATAQVVARTNEAARLALEWAYVTFKPSADWTLFVGRKRLPLFYFSDFQDVGYAYTWLRPPPDVYGWDVVNYNGANLRWQKTLANWNFKVDVFGGAERSKDNAYSTLMYADQPKEVRWTHLRGATLEFSRAWFSGRAVWIENDFEQIDQNSAMPDMLNSGETRGRQRITGLSMNIDAERWLVHGEYSVFDRSNFQYTARAYMLAAGYRLGKFTPMATLSGYAETSPFATYAPLVMRSQALTLRYELADSMALKLQLDHFGDRSPQGLYSGSARALSIGLDMVF